MAFLIILYFGLCVYSHVSAAIYIQKDYATNTCVRNHTTLELLLASSLKYAFLNNPPVCESNDTMPVSNNVATIKKSFKKGLFAHFGIKKLKKKNLREKRQTQTPSWRQPTGMPQGTVITYCNSSSCCTPKKTLIPLGNTYNLCRECVHLVTLPGNYSPRNHNHVTCQDTDYYETCLTGEGSCTTNTMAKSVTFNNAGISQTVTFMFGASCSCEIRTDSIFAAFI
ncbi:uncharacterized protein T16H12.9 isoform X2 [Hydra vulgaris]|uniref:Uncharacterized protein T16H12.9 isoform X2 n=1 Tax=Hydra vulgaris TaxID=6087 RepID=A0ABM4C5A6_HYDVU